MIYINKIDSTIQTIISKCFPSYNGKKIKLSTSPPQHIRSYWDGGSRSYFVFYSLDKHEVLSVEQNHPMFDSGKPHFLERLPDRFLLVEHVIFQGKDMGITIYANASDMTPMLPDSNDDITDDERIVLTFTKSYKSAYRFQEAKRVHQMTKDQWENSKNSLIAKGLLNKAGAITPNGKNAISNNEAKKW